jgi:hypothetical protein
MSVWRKLRARLSARRRDGHWVRELFGYLDDMA